jgi:outer membrane protein TolC
MDEREATLRAAREHLERTRERLAAGRTELERQHASVSETREHLAEIRRWLAGTQPSRADDTAR